MSAGNKWKIMDNERKELLSLARLPARLNTLETAVYLGFKPHDIPILVARGLLKPLGRPMPNSEKYFARSKLVEAENNEEWLSRATATLGQHWQAKNARKKSNGITIRLRSLAPAGAKAAG
jgi:hypothetical protein